MAGRLPGWVVDDRTSIREEAAPYRDRSPEERAAAMAAAVRAAARLLASRPDRDRVLAHRDPLPESSLRAIARLQRERRAGAHG